jgi:hypothetical protein
MYNFEIYLFLVESPAILPIAQRAYSATMGYSLISSLTNKGMPPRSIIIWV